MKNNDRTEGKSAKMIEKETSKISSDTFFIPPWAPWQPPSP